jgi:3-hydroxyisobutyrate dehydrogenase-like beta-hydroxyacid dehydrogenase
MTRQDGPVALAGLGNMGSAVAGRLAQRFRVLGFDVDPRRRADAADRYKIAVVEDVALLAQASILVLSLPTPDISATVVRTLLADLRPGTLIVETSTVNPTDMWRLRDVCSPAGVRVVDGAILSGVAQMAAGRSTLLVGGKAAMRQRECSQRSPRGCSASVMSAAAWPRRSSTTQWRMLSW